jgi:hypothetical protein
MAHQDQLLEDILQVEVEEQMMQIGLTLSLLVKEQAALVVVDYLVNQIILFNQDQKKIEHQQQEQLIPEVVEEEVVPLVHLQDLMALLAAQE